MIHSYLKGNTPAILAIGIGLVLSVLVLSLTCTGTAEAAVSDTWSKTFGGSAVEVGHSVIRVSDGYVAVGVTYSMGNGLSDAYVVKTYLNGTQAWYRTFGGTAHDTATSVISDGTDILVAGTTESFGNGTRDALLLKYGRNGNLLWNRTYGTGGQESISDVVKVNNGYVMTGSSGQKVLVVKTDIHGNQRWLKTYGDEGYQAGDVVTGLSDGCLVVASQQSVNFIIYLLKLDVDDGTVIKEKTYGMPDGHLSGIGVIARGSACYIGGEFSQSDSSINCPYLLKIDEDLDRLDEWIYPECPEYRNIHSMTSTSDGPVIAGYSSHMTYDPFLVRLSWDGALISSYNKSTSGTQVINSVTTAPDGDYVVAGQSNEDLYLAKIASSALDPTPTPAPASPTPTATATATAAPTAAPTPAPTTEPGAGPTAVPTVAPTAEPGATAMLPPGATESPTAAPSATPDLAGTSEGFSAGTVVIIVLLAVVATLLVVLIVMFLMRQK